MVAAAHNAVRKKWSTLTSNGKYLAKKYEVDFIKCLYLSKFPSLNEIDYFQIRNYLDREFRQIGGIQPDDYEIVLGDAQDAARVAKESVIDVAAKTANTGPQDSGVSLPGPSVVPLSREAAPSVTATAAHSGPTSSALGGGTPVRARPETDPANSRANEGASEGAVDLQSADALAAHYIPVFEAISDGGSSPILEFEAFTNTLSLQGNPRFDSTEYQRHRVLLDEINRLLSGDRPRAEYPNIKALADIQWDYELQRVSDLLERSRDSTEFAAQSLDQADYNVKSFIKRVEQYIGPDQRAQRSKLEQAENGLRLVKKARADLERAQRRLEEIQTIADDLK